MLLPGVRGCSPLVVLLERRKAWLVSFLVPYITLAAIFGLVFFTAELRTSTAVSNPTSSAAPAARQTAAPHQKAASETPAEQLTKMSFILNCFSSPPKPHALILARGGSKGIPRKISSP